MRLARDSVPLRESVVASKLASMGKLLRFITIYGLGRTLFKAMGRLRFHFGLPTLRRTQPDIGIIGCGQFAFATIGYFLAQRFGHRVVSCYDPDRQAQRSLAAALKVSHQPRSVEELLGNEAAKFVYIASNHASHAHYAIQALSLGKVVYIEKPVAVSHPQLVELVKAAGSGGRIFAGYDRPLSPAVAELKQRAAVDRHSGISLQCHVSGHMIAANHWYRKPTEGTRISGNAGHWIDLFCHFLHWRGLPDNLQISLLPANVNEFDDNFSLSISSDRNDIFSLMLTSRSEPFEGINETINFQHADTICKIDDFQRMTIWRGSKRWVRRIWPKDPGHRASIMQPFDTASRRDWNEVILSTLLILHIAEMVRQKMVHSSFSCADELDRLDRLVKAA